MAPKQVSFGLHWPLGCSSQIPIKRFMPASTFHFGPQPNCGFNADANIGHENAEGMAFVGVPLTAQLGQYLAHLWLEYSRLSYLPVVREENVVAYPAE